MKKKIAEEWVKELRSGHYRQGKRALKYKSKLGVVRHCCLGVLCEMYQKASKEKLKTNRKKSADDDLPVGSTAYLFEGRQGELPSKVRKWAGIGSEDGMFLGDVVVYRQENSTLAELNDDGCPFSDIANLIEERYKDI